MEHDQDYRGHIVHVWTTELADGRSRWSYTIDGKHFKECDDSSLPNEEMALKEGLIEVTSVIDMKLDRKT